MKFCPEHFPVGTVVQFNEEIRRMRSTEEGVDDGVRTVVSIVRNGVDSYVIKTGRKNRHIDGTPFADEGINISYVEAIIKRGDGRVEIDHSYFGTDPSLRQRVCRDAEIMELHQPMTFKRWSDKTGYLGEVTWTPKKRNHNTGAIRHLLILEVLRFAQPGLMFDYERMISDLFEQTWVTHVTERAFQFNVVNKKRLRRWLAQNRNRYLVPMKKARHDEDQQHQLDMEQFDQEWEKELENERRAPLEHDAGAQDMQEDASYYDLDDRSF